MTESTKIAITISRQLASGGAYIGHLVARKLGFPYFERAVLYQAAGELGIDIRELSQAEECCTGFIESLMKSFIFGSPEASYVPPARRVVYDRDLFDTESRIIRAIAEKHDAVIVGHAGFSVLRGHPRLINVFIHAPEAFRIRRLREFHALSTEEARMEIIESDQRREKFIRTMTGADWLDPGNYHLSIDAEAVGFEAAVSRIIERAKRTEA